MGVQTGKCVSRRTVLAGMATAGAAALMASRGAVALAATAAAPATKAPAFDWKRFKGQTINVAFAKYSWADFIVSRLPQFEQLTGIKANIELTPEDQNRQKMLISLTSGRGDIDVFMSQKHQEGEKFYRAGWYEGIQKYLDDPSMTSSDFDFKDFAEGMIRSVTVRNMVVGVPIFGDIQILTYRKDLFDKAKLAPPETLDDMAAAAQKLTDTANGVYGIALRGKGGAAVTMMTGYVYSMGGSWFNSKGEIELTTPVDLKAFKFYGDLARNYGPPGSLNFHWMQTQAIFSAGAAAMWQDSSAVLGDIWDPKKSMVSDKVGFTMFPAGPGGRKPGGGAWFPAIASQSKHKEAAWYFVQWALSKENVMAAQLQKNIQGARKSVYTSPQFRSQDKHPDLSETVLKSISLDFPSWLPEVVNVAEARDAIGAVIVTAIEGGDIEAAAKQATQRIREFEK